MGLLSPFLLETCDLKGNRSRGDYSKPSATRDGPKRMMSYYSKANGKEKPQEVVGSIQIGTLNIYESARRLFGR